RVWRYLGSLKMQIGKLDQQVTLMKPSSAKNDFGEVIETFISAGTEWAEVISQRGSEAFEAARTNARETIRVKIRWRADVETTWKVEWQGQSYNIKPIDRSQRREGVLWF